MKDEKKIIGTPGSEKSTEHRPTWVENIVDEIHDLDIEFPLSGNEDGKPHVLHHHATEEGEEKINTSWIGNFIDKVQDLDTDFPLSGGEEDPRPRKHQ